MTLDISQERMRIYEQVSLIQGVGIRMPQMLTQRRQLSQFQILLKLITKHLCELKHLESNSLDNTNPVKIDSYVQASIRIKNHMIRKGSQIKQMIKEDQMKPYALLALKCLSSILRSFEFIEKKIEQLIESSLSSSPQKVTLQQFS